MKKNKNKDNNFLFIQKNVNEIFNVNNNQDLSFISNSKETENLLEINGINISDFKDYKINYSNLGDISPLKDKQIFSLSNGLSSSQQSTNNTKYSNYIMLNSQLCYLSQKPNNFVKKKYYSYSQNKNCIMPKKRIEIEYYDIQPVTFQIMPIYIKEETIKQKYELELKKMLGKKEFKNCVGERVYQIQFRPYKTFRAVEMEFIKNDEDKKEEEKKKNEDKMKEEKEIQNNENMLEKSFNNKGIKKRRKRKKK